MRAVLARPINARRIAVAIGADIASPEPTTTVGLRLHIPKELFLNGLLALRRHAPYTKAQLTPVPKKTAAREVAIAAEVVESTVTPDVSNG